MKIVPSVLAEKFDDFLVKMRQAETFSDYVQIDIMDGIFVGSTSFPVEMLNSLSTTLRFEVHLMVKDPLFFLTRIFHPGLQKVIFHSESAGDPEEVIDRIRRRGLVPGLAVRPETGVDSFRKKAEACDTLLFLTVDPGYYGSPFRPEVLGKVTEARKTFPRKVIGVDGGVALDTLRLFHEAGVDYACVGSRIFLHGNPKENYQSFLQQAYELEKA